MEGRLQNHTRTLRTERYVLRSYQLPRYIPDDDG